LTTHRRYSFVYPLPHGGHDVVLQILQTACNQYWWFRDPRVEGQPYNRLSFSFTASARDKWFTHHRAMRLALDCFYALGMREADVPEPIWEPLPPHTNRGYGRSGKAEVS